MATTDQRPAVGMTGNSRYLLTWLQTQPTEALEAFDMTEASLTTDLAASSIWRALRRLDALGLITYRPGTRGRRPSITLTP